MSRWNIDTIFFLNDAGDRRDVAFDRASVNVVTGASGTGKSTLIKAIDYCLGSEKCELPAHVRRRATAVGIRWTDGSSQMIIGRLIPPVGIGTSTRMFVSTGTSIPLPETVDDLQGPTNVAAGKAFLERAFGIGDLTATDEESGERRGRATVRHVTPYMFVTKEIILSENALLYGLDQRDEAPDIIATMPYFLRVVDEAAVLATRRLRTLRTALKRAEAKDRARRSYISAFRERARGLLSEAEQLGMTSTRSGDEQDDELLAELRKLTTVELAAASYPTESEYARLQEQRRDILAELRDARARMQALKTTIRDASGFQTSVSRQQEKLNIATHLSLDEIAGVCPVCESPSDRGRKIAQDLSRALALIGSESVAVERVRPRLLDHERELERHTELLHDRRREIDGQIKTWLEQTDETKRLANLDQLKARLIGRISFFLESQDDLERNTPMNLQILRDEVNQLEELIDRDAIAVRRRQAERRISRYATDALSRLPTVEPCNASELDFSIKEPAISVIEDASGAVLGMTDVGSDQNYLAIHIALSFAIQRFLAEARSPVPGVLVFDQISRPYFPERRDDEEHDETVIEADEEFAAMRQHVDFLFTEVERQTGLQVILIEHAYFADDPRYRDATKERWRRGSGQALIPLDWQTRDDG